MYEIEFKFVKRSKRNATMLGIVPLSIADYLVRGGPWWQFARWTVRSQKPWAACGCERRGYRVHGTTTSAMLWSAPLAAQNYCTTTPPW